MRKKNERRIEVPENPSRVKGKFVESVVAAMHDIPGVMVHRNARLRPLMGGRPREIDVLIDGSVAGYPFRLAIECKNERGRAGAQEIDAFVGKLNYLGIPPQQGIFVSVSGFTKGASDCARKAGVRILVLLGLKTTFEDSSKFVLKSFMTEDELSAALDAQSASLHITTRIRLPRIQIREILWPPSEDAWRKLREITTPDHNGHMPVPESVDITALEPCSLVSLFKPAFVTPFLKTVLGAEVEG